MKMKVIHRQLLDKIVTIKDVINNLQGRIHRRGFSKESTDSAKSLLKQAKELLIVFKTSSNTNCKKNI